MSGEIPSPRIRVLKEGEKRSTRSFVLYWMTAARRTCWNFALDRAVAHAQELGKGLVVLETLDCGGRWNSERSHQFVLQGMVENAARLRETPLRYYPYVADKDGAAAELAAALARHACVVVTDDFPIRETTQQTAAAAQAMEVLAEAVDSNGLLPLRAADKTFPTAYAFRRFVQSELPAHLDEVPKPGPLTGAQLPRAGKLPGEIRRRWPPATDRLLEGGADALADLPLDHTVSPVRTRGGSASAEAALREFLDARLERYAEQRNQPEEDVTSGLSPFLHHGHISTHQVFAELMEAEEWSSGDLSERATGSRKGWWGVGETAEAFLDELVTWRELGYNMCSQRTDYERYSSLPEWALTTLSEHTDDMRPHVYSLDELERGETHDELWNAAQMQLVREGRLHNYLRMLWGKKILEWSPTPEDALEALIELNNKYALDAPNPNSYSGIFWILGRYDRAWGPERPIFGKIRYMSSENTARKVRVNNYVRTYAP